MQYVTRSSKWQNITLDPLILAKRAVKRDRTTYLDRINIVRNSLRCGIQVIEGVVDLGCVGSVEVVVSGSLVEAVQWDEDLCRENTAWRSLLAMSQVLNGVVQLCDVCSVKVVCDADLPSAQQQPC